MKRRLSLFLAVVLAMTMIMGMSVTAFALGPNDPGTPKVNESVIIVDTTFETTIWECIPYELEAVNDWERPFIVYLYKYEPVDADHPSNPDGIGAMMIYSEDGWRVSNAYIDTETLDLFKTLPKASIDGMLGRSMMEWKGGKQSPSDSVPASSPAHVHEWTEGVIYEATTTTDGLEGIYCKTCGAIKEASPISAYGYTLNNYAVPMINNAKPGQTITFEFGEYNSFPKVFMEKIAAKSMEGITFVFHYNWNHVKQEIKIPAGTPIDLNFDWYGPAKMAELYGAN